MGTLAHQDAPPPRWDADGPLTAAQAREVAGYWGSRFPHVESYRTQLAGIRSRVPAKWRQFDRRVDYSLAVQEALVRLLRAYGRRQQYEASSIDDAIAEVEEEIATGRWPA